MSLKRYDKNSSSWVDVLSVKRKSGSTWKDILVNKQFVSHSLTIKADKTATFWANKDGEGYKYISLPYIEFTPNVGGGEVTAVVIYVSVSGSDPAMYATITLEPGRNELFLYKAQIGGTKINYIVPYNSNPQSISNNAAIINNNKVLLPVIRLNQNYTVWYIGNKPS